MPSTASPHSVRRPALLAGSAMLALLISATAAQAQSGAATATGPQALTNQQMLRDGVIVADASGTEIRREAGDIERGELAVSDNEVAATGRGNGAGLTLDAIANSAGGDRVAGLTAGAGSAAANGTMVIASRQAVDAKSVNGNIIGTHMSIASGNATSSSVALTNNAQDATATGNDLSATLSATQGGAGVASHQTLDSQESLAARARSGFGVTTGALAHTQVEASGNLDRAVATGNSAASTLSLEAPMLTLDARNDLASIISTSDGTVLANGAMATSISQSASGILKAVIFEDNGDPTVSVLIEGDATSSSVTSDGNRLSAAARGNLATTNVEIAAATIAPAGGQTGRPAAVATLATAQEADGLDLRAFTTGDIRATLDGELTGSDVSASHNAIHTSATANRSESSLSLAATTIDADRGRALASVDATGFSIADAGAVIHNLQDYGSSPVRVAHSAAKIGVKATGAIAGSQIGVDGNSERVTATGNDTANALSVDAGTIGTSLAVNSLQTGTGDVRASAGSAAIPGNFGIAADAGVTNSRLSVRDNRFLASAIGNLGTNAVGVVATAMRGTADVQAISGPLGDTYGAAADVALASNQKLGAPGNEGLATPTIRAENFTLAGILMGEATGSTLRLEDNVQQATAIGNRVANRLSIEAVTLDGGSGALASQYGQAHVSATSNATFLAGSASSSSTRISGNINAALAAINDADNALAVGAVTVSGAGAAAVESGNFGPPLAQGDHVLSNQQFAIGSAGAFVTTTITGGEPVAGTDGATYRVSGNRTSGEASANRAANAVSVHAVDGAASAGLANTQVNAATTQVSAAGTTQAPLGTWVSASDVAVMDNAVSALARGNAAANKITLSAGAASPGPTGLAVVDRFGAEAAGGAALLNVQTNLAPVTATADGSILIPLNAGTVDGSRFSVSGNAIVAAAYSNVATNGIAVSWPSAVSAAIASNQVNSGNVEAIVTGGRPGGGTLGALGAADFTMSGNLLSATAVGNQVSSAITASR